MSRNSKEVNFLSTVGAEIEELEQEGKHNELANLILKLMLKNMDLSLLAGKVIKLLSLPYPPLKKVLYAFLTRYASGVSDLSILSINSLLKDFEDPNPFVRKLVVKTVCSITSLWELATTQILPRALTDSSPLVRFSSATSCALVIDSQSIVHHQEIIDQLYAMIRDPDPTVVCSSLCSLDRILASEGGVVMNVKISAYLIGRIGEFHAANFTIVCSVLKKFVPKSSEELIAFLNLIDDRLSSTDPAIFLPAVDIGIFYAQKLKVADLEAEIVKHVMPQVKLRLFDSATETTIAMLEFVLSQLPMHKEILVSYHQCFVSEFSDSDRVKVLKLKIVPHLVSQSNAPEVIEELLSHSCSNAKDISSQAIESFVSVIQKCPDTASSLESFVSLIDIKHNDLDVRILNSLIKLELNEFKDVKEAVIKVISANLQHASDTKSKQLLLMFLYKYGKEIPDAPYILEKLSSGDSIQESEEFCSLLLMTMVKLFLARPGEMQLVLGCAMKNITKSPSLLLQKQAVSFYNLLKQVEVAKRVMNVGISEPTGVNLE